MRCQRPGCHHPQQHPDPLGLHFCTHHNHQFRNGTIGQDYDPTRREHATVEAAALIQLIAKPNDSLRDLEGKTGLCKDTINNILRGKYAHIRSAAWEQLQEAVANYIYEQNMKGETWATEKKRNQTHFGGGTQPSLFQ